ncbi:hypothetical protein R3W88_027150 [Solanum pinnatisectum]|uniref:Transmembrane protein n=1 Tax=Solanum pinnatisectum TaxID=50273 RepID=A0AAV9LF82_9SOLN|nr:hypothetical protein R3W88_027150 [Solanum pinnatisectum]
MSLPPPMIVDQQAYSDHRDHGSVGPVIAILIAIFVLGAIFVIIGKVCSGHGLMGRCFYDFEGWVETNCGSCIDGWVNPISPGVTGSPPVVVESYGSHTNTPVSEAVREREEEEAYS